MGRRGKEGRCPGAGKGRRWEAGARDKGRVAKVQMEGGAERRLTNYLEARDGDMTERGEPSYWQARTRPGETASELSKLCVQG